MTTPSDSAAYPGVANIKDDATKQALRLVWDAIRYVKQRLQGPTQGTLNPDQKPTGLGPKDRGFYFLATDFNRLYRWTGIAWEDDPAVEPRFQIVFFSQTPEPVTGWAACNGATVPRSTSAGRTVTFTTPVVPAYQGFTAWIRL